MAKVGFVDSSKSIYRGLLVPDPRITGPLWEAESDATEEGIGPGVVVSGGVTSLALLATGQPDAGAPALEVTAARSGFPARDLGVRIAVRRDAEYETGVQQGAYDHWAAHVPQSRGLVVLQGSVESMSAPDAASIPGGGVLVAVEAVTPGGIQSQVRTLHRSVDGVWTDNGVAYATPAFSNTQALGAVVVLPNGKALLFVLRTDISETGLQCDQYISDDDGTTWTLTAAAVFPTLPLPRYEPRRLRCAYGGPGELLLMLSLRDTDATTREDVVLQYASSDLGASFVEIGLRQDGTTGVLNVDKDAPEPQADWLQSAGVAEVVGDRAGFLVVYAEPNLEDMPTVRRLSSAFTAFATVTAAYIRLVDGAGFNVSRPCASGNPYSDADLTVAADTNGTLWVYWRDPTAPANVEALTCAMSNDTGALWRPAPHVFLRPGVLARIDSEGVDGRTLKELAVAWDRGRAVLVHQHLDALAAPGAGVLYEAVFGGWMGPRAVVDAEATLPGELASQGIPEDWYIPMVTPGSMGWTADHVNGTSVATGETLDITAGGADRRRWSKNFGGFEATGVLDAELLTPAGSVTLEFTVLTSVGGDSLTARFRRFGTNIYVVETDNDGQLINISIGGADRVQMAFGVSAGTTLDSPRVAAWIRVMSPQGSPRQMLYDPPWRLVFEGVVTLDGSASQTRVRFGTWDGASGDARIWSLAYGFGANTGGVENPAHWAQGQLTPAAMQGRALTVIPVHALDGVYLSAAAGPAFTNDTWTHTPLHDFASENLAPRLSRSPAQGWLATELGDATFAWDLSGQAADTFVESPVIGLHVERTNHPTWRLEGYVQGSGWAVLADIDTRDAFGSFVATVEGDAVKLELDVAPADLSADGYYLADRELVGGTFYADGGTAAWEILHNTGGLLTTGSAGGGVTRVPRLFIERSGGDLSLAEARLCPPRFTLLVRTALTPYRGLRLTAVFDPFASGDAPIPKAGVAVLGAAYLFGLDYDRSSSTTRTPAVDRDQDASGQLYTRVRGKSRRSVAVSWTKEGVWTGQIYAELADEYAKFSDAAGEEPFTSLHELPMVLDGLVDGLDGSHVPVVLLRKVPRLVDPATWVLVARELAGGAVYGHMTGALQLQSDFARYADKELFTVGFTIEEEV